MSTLFDSGVPAAGKFAKPSSILIWDTKRNPSVDFLVVIMASGILLVVRVHDGDDDGVAQYGGNSPNKELTETCTLGLLCTSLILDIHVMIN